MTLYNAPASVLSEIDAYLSDHHRVKFPRPLKPCDSIEWAVENKRSLSGYITTEKLRISESGDIYVKAHAQVHKDEPEHLSAAISIEDGGISVTIHCEQVKELEIQRDLKGNSFSKVGEIVFTE